MKISFSSQKGLGLIESAFTLLIIAGAAIALLRFQNYIAYSANASQQQSDAIQLAINEIETLRDFSVLSGGGSSYQNIASGNSTSNGVNTTYTITWTITTNASPSYKVIDVTVTWTDRYGNAKSIEQTSRVAGVNPSSSIGIM